MKKTTRRVIIFSLTLLALLILFIASFNQLLPIVNARAIQHSRSHATKVINEAVKIVLEEEDVKYSDLISINYDNEGKVMSLSSNVIDINKLKSKVSLKILEIFSQYDQQLLKIPIGNLTGMYILSGRGFKLSIKLIPTDSVTATISSNFEEVGINQSRHTITMDVNLILGVIILGEHSTVTVSDQIIIGDTIIVGQVPDAYTKIEKVNDDMLGEIIDFQANN